MAADLSATTILHRINPFEGERYSVAVNIWEQAPLTTTAAEPPA